ncbi:MAG: citrate (Si)-synthase [Chlamydiales bacterium]|nr:citrate (Si)-synthase [Chlamydiales bacterium]
MREGVIFEITKEHLETGMRGFPVGYCVTSYVDPYKGLTYVGKPITEIQQQHPLEVIYLLYHGQPGTGAQVKMFEEMLRKRAKCKPQTLKTIESLPRKGHPMDAFAAALLIAGMEEGVDNYREDCLQVIAKLPQIAACLINYLAGWGPTPEPKPELGYIENFVHMLQMPGKKTSQLLDVMRLFNVLHYDHDGGNLSTFVGKAVASSQEPMWGSLAAAMTGLAGPRHGRANQDCLEFVQSILSDLGEKATAQDMQKLIRHKLANHELLFGFGHAVLRVEDPRATIFYDYAESHFPQNPLVKMALLLRKEGSLILKENPKISDPYPNVDAISGTVLMAAGFTYPQFFTVLFGLSRCVGIAIQIVYERLEAREGKGTPLIRPLYLYRVRNPSR